MAAVVDPIAGFAERGLELLRSHLRFLLKGRMVLRSTRQPLQQARDLRRVPLTTTGRREDGER